MRFVMLSAHMLGRIVGIFLALMVIICTPVGEGYGLRVAENSKRVDAFFTRLLGGDEK